jgi:hypothetical protein
LVAALSTPQKFNGKRIRVCGVLHVEERNVILALSQDGIDMGDDSSAVELYPNYKTLGAGDADLASLDGAYVIIEGVLCCGVNAQGDVIYPLTLKDVTRIGFRGRPLRRDEILKRLGQAEGDMSSRLPKPDASGARPAGTK